MSLFDNFTKIFNYKDNKILYKKLGINYSILIIIFIVILLFSRKTENRVSKVSYSPVQSKNNIILESPVEKKLRIPDKITPPRFKMSSFLDSLDH